MAQKPKPDFFQAFAEGEQMGFAFIKEINVKFLKEFPKKSDTENRLYLYTALLAGFLSSSLYHSYVELDRSLKESNGVNENAELFIQKVFTCFVDRLNKDKRPIECRFAISRKR